MKKSRKIDVFVDLENVSPGYREASCPWSLLTLHLHMAEVLESLGYSLNSVTCFAQRPSILRWHSFCLNIGKRFTLFGWNIIWSHEIADEALIREVETRYIKGKLEKAVLLLTSDNDFAPLAEKLRAQKIDVLVSGRCIGYHLTQNASQTFPLFELMQPIKMAPNRPRAACWPGSNCL